MSAAFQFTPLREGRQASMFSVSMPSYFNSRPSARGDGVAHALNHEVVVFQFTPLREGRRGQSLNCTPSVLFQFTPLREGRPRFWRAFRRCKNFNSRPSARGDRRGQHIIKRLLISIHAPPRGATVAFTDVLHCRNISIHAPPRGATERPDVEAFVFIISIHAPPRGATGLVVA